jgi:hypothetical protein
MRGFSGVRRPFRRVCGFRNMHSRVDPVRGLTDAGNRHGSAHNVQRRERNIAGYLPTVRAIVYVAPELNDVCHDEPNLQE